MRFIDPAVYTPQDVLNIRDLTDTVYSFRI